MPANLGNQIMRRAFAGDDDERRERMADFRRVLNVEWPTAYRYLQEVGPYGSGRPSPLHKLCQLIELCHALDLRERTPISYARELAEYPLRFFTLLAGAGAAAAADTVQRMNFLLKSASDANYLLKGRMLERLSPGELKEFRRFLRDAVAAARDLEAEVEARLREAEADYPGAPVQREQASRFG